MTRRHKSPKIGTLDEYVKANKKASREAELETFGHPLNFNRVHRSKKTYNRNKIKADAVCHLPFDLYTLQIGHKKTATEIQQLFYTFKHRRRSVQENYFLIPSSFLAIIAR